MSPLVLAVPSFRSERFIAETLQSLHAQGDTVRWWLQDGGSTDRTLEIARAHARAGDTIVSERDAGQADALNRAMRAMGGEIIGFLNSDDGLAPGAAERVLDFFTANPEVDLVAGGIEWIDENGVPDGVHAGRIESLDDVLDIYRVWWRERQWVQPEVFYRRTLWERVGGFDTRYDLAFDFDFWVRCFLAGARVAHLPAPLARFRRHAGQKSAAATRAADEIRTIVRRHLPAAPIPCARRWVLSARLAYDVYQSSASERRPLAVELVRHPHWLLAPEVRSRIQTACSRRLLRAESTAR